jgi:hypothetical protein
MVLSFLLRGCATWSLALREELEAVVHENRALRKILERKTDVVRETEEKMHNEELNDLCSSQNIIRVIQAR